MSEKEQDKIENSLNFSPNDIAEAFDSMGVKNFDQQEIESYRNQHNFYQRDVIFG